MSPTQPAGYLAIPSTGTGSPVLVLHAWWGLNNTFRVFCDRLAEAGFVAFAPDLYQGKVTDQIAEAKTLASELDKTADQVKADLENAVTFLKEQTGSGDSGIVVIGFSMGAYYALELAADDPDNIRSVVLFYGTGPVDFSRSKADYLGHFAANDDFEPESSVSELEQDIRSAGRSVTFYRYPNTGHWFFEPDRPEAYNSEAAGLAWERTLAFLNRASSS